MAGLGKGTKTVSVLAVETPGGAELLAGMLAAAPDLVLVGSAAGRREALELVAKLDPAVICLGSELAVEEGVELIGELLSRWPRPVLVVGPPPPRREQEVLRLLDCGALAFAPLPRGADDPQYRALAAGLVATIRILAGVRVIHRPWHETLPLPSAVAVKGEGERRKLVVIGSSTGGPGALRTILGALPADFRLPVVCVQHIGSGFQQGLVRWLGEQCRLKVTVAREGGHLSAGTVYFPEEGRHLEFDEGGRFLLSDAPPYHGHRPSITVTMRSAARRFARGAAGVLLTGMGDDGAEGLGEIARAGGAAIAQDEVSCVVFGMPRKAIELGAARQVLPLQDIAAALIELAR